MKIKNYGTKAKTKKTKQTKKTTKTHKLQTQERKRNHNNNNDNKNDNANGNKWNTIKNKYIQRIKQSIHRIII